MTSCATSHHVVNIIRLSDETRPHLSDRLLHSIHVEAPVRLLVQLVPNALPAQQSDERTVDGILRDRNEDAVLGPRDQSGEHHLDCCNSIPTPQCQTLRNHVTLQHTTATSTLRP